MAQVILFGGGDAGGIIITEHGVRRIPPFDPGTRLQLRGLSALANAGRYAHGDAAKELSGIVGRLSSDVIGRVERIVGPLSGANSLVYDDPDGGFVCGSTGQPPIPFPPRGTVASISDLVAGGALEPELIGFLNEATKRGVSVDRFLEDPSGTAEELGVSLSERAAGDLQRLAPSNVGQIADPVEREVVTYFHAVVRDGHHYTTWATEPYETSKRLDVTLSDAAIGRLLHAGSSAGNAAFGPIAVAIAVGIVIMLVDRPISTINEQIQDRSGVAKF
jgi:hypothetical protein